VPFDFTMQTWSETGKLNTENGIYPAAQISAKIAETRARGHP